MGARTPVGASGLILPRFEGPLDLSRKMVQLRNLQGRQQFNQVQLQRAQAAQKAEQKELKAEEQAQKERRLVDQIVAKHQGDWRKALPEIMRVAPRRGLSLRKELAEWDKLDAERKQEIIATDMARTKRRGQLALGIRDQSSYEAGIKKAVEEDLISEEEGQQMLSVPYDPENVDAIRKQALTLEQFYAIEQKRNERTVKEKDFQFWADSQRETRNLPRNATTDRMLREEYRKLGEKKPTTPFAAFAFGGPEGKKLATEWVELQNKYRDATTDQKRQLDAITARFNREMKLVQAQVRMNRPSEEQIQRMEAILRKANEDYDAVLTPMVSVISPDGVEGEIPRSQLQDAIKEGYKLLE